LIETQNLYAPHLKMVINGVFFIDLRSELRKEIIDSVLFAGQGRQK
jgi:hypothetical protein